MGKFNFEVVMTNIRPTGIIAHKNSDSLCGVFNSERSQFKSRSLHKRKPPSFATRFYWNCEYHRGKQTDLEMLPRIPL